MIRALTVLLTVSAAVAAEPRFEVISAKPAAASQHSGLRFKETPGRIHYTSVSFRELVTRAYRLKDYQVEGPPWMETSLYDIDATYPADAEPRVSEMLQVLLAERFKLRTRAVDKAVKGLALRYLSSSRSVLKPTAEPGKGGVALRPDKLTGNLATMDNLCDLLTAVMRTPVVDQTGLTGKYDFELKLPPDAVSTGQSGLPDPGAIAVSLKAAGLSLVGASVNDKHIIVEYSERIPSQN